MKIFKKEVIKYKKINIEINRNIDLNIGLNICLSISSLSS